MTGQVAKAGNRFFLGCPAQMETPSAAPPERRGLDSMVRWCLWGIRPSQVFNSDPLPRLSPQGFPWRLKQSSEQRSSNASQTGLGPGFSFFLSLMRFLLRFLTVAISRFFQAWHMKHPTARITKSKRRSKPLARTQNIEGFSG